MPVNSIVDTVNNMDSKADVKNSAEEFIFKELDTLSQKVKSTPGMPGDLSEKLIQMLDRLNRMAKLGHYASEFDTLSRYIETVTSIPWEARTTDVLDLTDAKETLDKNHYGMGSVKDIILEYLATMQLLKQRSDNPNDAIAKSPVLLLVGLQGIGKTTLAISIAETLQRKFIRIAMGGLGSPLELRGRSKAYPEAEPGQVVKGLIRAGVRNPVILLDEIDKASGEEGLRKDIMAIMLELLDPNQNHSFRDQYIDYPLDLSEALFICSANNTGTITTALMDRMEVIRMPSYTDEEKTVIARDYLFPKVVSRTGLKPEELTIDEALWPNVVRPFGFDSGIRGLNRTLEAISRKVAREIVEGKTQKVHLTQENLKQYLPK